jgi:hypothetical protein
MAITYKTIIITFLAQKDYTRKNRQQHNRPKNLIFNERADITKSYSGKN